MSEKFIIGIDLGGTNLKIALIDRGFKIRHHAVLNTQACGNKNSLIETIVKSVDKIIFLNKLSKRDISGIGLGLPGPVDARKGVVHFFPNIPGWKSVQLKDILEAKTGIKVLLDNDAKLMALAEFTLGAAKGSSSAMCVTLGTGVGGGLIIDGKVYRGVSNAAGEIGHMPINLNGPVCSCGGKACLEKYIGNSVILKEARRSFRRDISLEELSSLAKKGNARARAIWSRVGECLGVALTQVVNLLNPDCIVIGGGVANAGEVLFSRVRQTIKIRSMSVQSGQVRIKKAVLGSDAGVIGAAILVKGSVN